MKGLVLFLAVVLMYFYGFAIGGKAQTIWQPKGSDSTGVLLQSPPNGVAISKLPKWTHVPLSTFNSARRINGNQGWVTFSQPVKSVMAGQRITWSIRIFNPFKSVVTVLYSLTTSNENDLPSTYQSSKLNGAIAPWYYDCGARISCLWLAKVTLQPGQSWYSSVTGIVKNQEEQVGIVPFITGSAIVMAQNYAALFSFGQSMYIIPAEYSCSAIDARPCSGV